MNIAVLIGIMISIVVGVAMIPMITSTTDGITGACGSSEHPEMTDCGSDNPDSVASNSAVRALIDVIPYIFVAVILLGAVSWIGSASSSYSDKSDPATGRRLRKGFVTWIKYGKWRGK